ncbi:MAG: flavodoxin/nitric oxide synthase [Nocardioides sp.]|nr:flavodoxin/nitric oxide synthase [Nocardioides sp.]
MMRVLIVFESMFGLTAALAEAVAAGLRGRGAEVSLLRAGAPGDHDLAGCDLLVLAAPTHALTLSRPASRADAVERGADEAAATTGIREWMAALDVAVTADHRPVVAVFDTRARIARHWPGSAARATTRVMRGKGFDVRERASFYVEDVTGPLLPGELERAHGWGRQLATDLRGSPVDRGAGA